MVKGPDDTAAAQVRRLCLLCVCIHKGVRGEE